MKKKSNPQPRPACLPAREGGFFNLRVSIGLLTVVAGLLFVLSATANPSKGGGRGFGARSNGPTPSRPSSGQLTGRTFARVTPNGVITENLLGSERQDLARATRLRRASARQAPERAVLGPL